MRRHTVGLHCHCDNAERLQVNCGTKTSEVRRLKKTVYLVSRGTLLPSTQLSCSGTLSGGVVCSSAGDWPATGAGLPVGGVSCLVEFRDWPVWCVALRAWLRAVTEGCWRWGGGTGGRLELWWLDGCSVNNRRENNSSLHTCKSVALTLVALSF